MQTLNQGSQPIGMRTKWSRLSASRPWLRCVRKCSLGMLGLVGAAEQWPKGVSCGKESLFGVLKGLCFPRSVEEWLLLSWRDTRDIGHWRSKVVPSFGGRTPLSTKIFTMRLQNGRHICATNRLAVFPIENVSTNVNQSTCNEITQKLCFSKSLQFWSKLRNSNGRAFGKNLMISS